MVCSMRRAWCPFVKDRANAFADFTPTTPHSDMGVPREGSVQEALARPGVYAADLACANEETSWTCLDPRVSGEVFREPAGGIVDHYLTSQAKFLTLTLTLTLTPILTLTLTLTLTSQAKFFREVGEVFNEDDCCGGALVFATKQ